jgi:hypothetical protein
MEIPQTISATDLRLSLINDEKQRLDDEEDSVINTSAQTEVSANDDNREEELMIDTQFEKLRDEQKRQDDNNSWLIQNMYSKV